MLFSNLCGQGGHRPGFFWKKKSLWAVLLKQPPEVFCKKKVFLEISQNSQEKTSARDSFLIKLQDEACNFIKKESLADVFSCEFCEISKSTCGRLLLVLWAVQISLTNLQVSWRPLISWFMKPSHLSREYASMLFVTQHESDLNLLSAFN